MRSMILLLSAGALVACERQPAPTPAQPAPGAAAPQQPPTQTAVAPSTPAVDPATGRVTLEGISFKPGDAWRATTPSVAMRNAEYVISGDAGDATLAIFHFPGGAGDVNSNIERWCGQFAQPDGANSIERAEIDQAEVGGMALYTIWLTGTYVAAMTPGSPELNNEPGWALLGAIVETPSAQYFFKAVGPEPTLAVNREAFDEMIGSFQAQ